MAVGMCLYAQLVQSNNTLCKSAIIMRYHPYLSGFCSRPRLTQTYNHIIYPGVARWQQANTQQPIGVVGLMVGYKQTIRSNAIGPAAGRYDASLRTYVFLPPNKSIYGTFIQFQRPLAAKVQRKPPFVCSHSVAALGICKKSKTECQNSTPFSISSYRTLAYFSILRQFIKTNFFKCYTGMGPPSLYRTD